MMDYLVLRLMLNLLLGLYKMSYWFSSLPISPGAKNRA